MIKKKLKMLRKVKNTQKVVLMGGRARRSKKMVWMRVFSRINHLKRRLSSSQARKRKSSMMVVI